MWFIGDYNNGVFKGAEYPSEEAAKKELEQIVKENIENEAEGLQISVRQEDWELSPAHPDYQYLSRVAAGEDVYQVARDRILAFHFIEEG